MYTMFNGLFDMSVITRRRAGFEAKAGDCIDIEWQNYLKRQQIKAAEWVEHCAEHESNGLRKCGQQSEPRSYEGSSTDDNTSGGKACEASDDLSSVSTC